MKNESIETTALIDCGAEGTFIYKELVKQHQLPTYALNRPIIARNVDNTINKEGVITRYTCYETKCIFAFCLLSSLHNHII